MVSVNHFLMPLSYDIWIQAFRSNTQGSVPHQNLRLLKAVLRATWADRGRNTLGQCFSRLISTGWLTREGGENGVAVSLYQLCITASLWTPEVEQGLVEGWAGQGFTFFTAPTKLLRSLSADLYKEILGSLSPGYHFLPGFESVFK